MDINRVIICWGTTSGAYQSNGELITLPITYSTSWKGFGGNVSEDAGYMNKTTIPGCMFRTLSTAYVCNRSVVLSPTDYINYLTIGY